ncbi:hypothetical protein ACQPXS_01940 [Streptomyces sp. CA-142005]|uniref:hypothetical protein n=1 Tax=Streptomyces sp. CA-142005 TaxID=3240052 RepID=UPI003D907F2D
MLLMWLGAISTSIASHTARADSGDRPPRVAVDEGFEVVGVGAFEGLEVGRGVIEGDLVELRGAWPAAVQQALGWAPAERLLTPPLSYLC